MIPEKLEIEGLFSYRTKQVIDFNTLTASGLFGIFGPVGSGKSTILEAILLALYGSAERLSERGERGHLINLQSNTCRVVFFFKAGTNDQFRYKAFFELIKKRNSKDELIKFDTRHEIYRLVGDQYINEGTDAEAILGMSKQHFLQTVIIPQGKFREFIDLKPKERAGMMNELFHLERFDLSQKAGAVYDQVKADVLIRQTQIEQLNHINEEVCSELEQTCHSLELHLKTLRSTFDTIKESVSKSEKVYEKHLQLQQFESQWRQLLSQQPHFDELKHKIELNLLVERTFKPIHEQLCEAKHKSTQISQAKENTAIRQQSIQQRLGLILEKEKQIHQKLAQQPIREARIRDLKRLINIKELEIQLQHSEITRNEISEKLDQARDNLERIASQIQIAESELENINTPDATKLARLITLCQELENMDTRLEEAKNQEQQTSSEITLLTQELNELMKSLPSGVVDFSAWLEQLNNQLADIQRQLEVAKEMAGLSAFTHLLTPDLPCPLCGAIHHPEPLKPGNQLDEITRLEGEMARLKSTINEADKLQKTVFSISVKLDSARRNYNHNIQILSNLEKTAEALNLELDSLNIGGRMALTQAIRQSENLISKKNAIENTLKTLRNEHNSLRLDYEKWQKQWNELEQNFKQIQAVVKAKRVEFEEPQFVEKYLQRNNSEISKAIELVEADINNIIQENEKVKSESDQLRSELASVESDLKNLEMLQQEWQNKENTLKLRWNKAMQDLPQNIAENTIIHIIENAENTAEKEESLRAYNEQKIIVQNKIKELSAEEDVLRFDIQAFEQLQVELSRIKSELDESQKAYTLKQYELQQSGMLLSQKAELMQQLDQLINRKMLVEKVYQLLKGDKFIKFISSIFLKDLCHAANKRFMHLTKNRLSLLYDDENNFQVIDYLNNGQMRLLKTLSGGQIFQASLCLALALAEQVKALCKAEQSFFFIDEGFGSLDKESLSMVFETLKTLRLENRVVGIISHVEELQQEIGVYAKVHLDAEKGSLIEYSFE